MLVLKYNINVYIQLIKYFMGHLGYSWWVVLGSFLVQKLEGKAAVYFLWFFLVKLCVEQKWINWLTYHIFPIVDLNKFHSSCLHNFHAKHVMAGLDSKNWLSGALRILSLLWNSSSKYSTSALSSDNWVSKNSSFRYRLAHFCTLIFSVGLGLFTETCVNC